MHDLVRQLEKAFEWSNDPMLSEAADEITTLRARLEVVEAAQIMLRAERDGLASLLLSVQQDSIAATKALATARGFQAEAEARAERAEAALATARRDAMEEAERVCLTIRGKRRDGIAIQAAEQCAAAIRALANEAET